MDLNNLTEYRIYRTTSGTIVKTLKNIPANISVDGEVLIIWLPFIMSSSFGCQILFSTYSSTDVGVPVWFFLNLIVCDSPVILPVPYSTSLKNGLLFTILPQGYRCVYIVL